MPGCKLDFSKRAINGLFFVYFRLFKRTLKFLQQLFVKNVPLVNGAGIRTHDLQDMILLPYRPRIQTVEICFFGPLGHATSPLFLFFVISFKFHFIFCLFFRAFSTAARAASFVWILKAGPLLFLLTLPHKGLLHIFQRSL